MRQVHVLLVEDDAIEARLARARLARLSTLDVSVTHASTLKAALAALETTSFDLVLLDLLLPDSRDEVTYAAVRAATPATPIVVASGLDDLDLAARLIAAGAADVLDKSALDLARLERVLVRALAR